MNELSSPTLDRLVAEFDQSGLGELRLVSAGASLHLRRGREPRIATTGNQQAQPSA